MNNSIKAILMCTLFIYLFGACKKEQVITSPNAFLNLSTDSLYFDTVFTSTGSVTKFLKVANPNSQKIILSSVQLIGGATSAFALNVDGSSGNSFQNISIAANDSIYVFATVRINPSAVNLPFLVQDSIEIKFNGNTAKVQLTAYGQNANFLRNISIQSDTTWTNEKPFVIIGNCTVNAGKKLTIQKGCNLYFQANAPLIVNGTLQVNGAQAANEKVTFTGNRLDEPYREFPGSWPGIVFNASSNNNVLTHAIIKNAYQALVVGNMVNANPKLTLQQCIINNAYDMGIRAVNASINANNCLISNCGNNINIQAGNYQFTNCTIASYGNSFIAHKLPVVSISNTVSANTTAPLSGNFTNCIIYGEGGIVENEIVVNKQGTTPFSVLLENVLYKAKDDPNNTVIINSIKNILPQFDTINTSDRTYNFRLRSTSPAINKGKATIFTQDLDGNNRNILVPDLGCYEKQ